MVITIQMSVKVDAITSSAHRLISPVVLLDRSSPSTADTKKAGNTSTKPSSASQSQGQFLLTPSYTFSFTLIINKGNFHDASLVHITGYTKDEFHHQTDEESAIYKLKEDVTRYPNSDIIVHLREDSNKFVEKARASEVPQILTLNKVRFCPEGKTTKKVKFPICAFANFIIQPNGSVQLSRFVQQNKGAKLYHFC